MAPTARVNHRRLLLKHQGGIPWTMNEESFATFFCRYLANNIKKKEKQHFGAITCELYIDLE